MRFLVDAQLPPALVRLLSDHGHTAEHVVNIGMGDASDTSIWTYALDQETIIVTKDEDFPHRQSQSQKDSPAIVWLRIGNTSRKALLEWFEPMLPKIESLIQQGDRLIEIR